MNIPDNNAMDSLRNQSFPVLDDGFIQLVDWMGNDSAIVQSARVSYGEGTKKPSEDRSLIRYLMRNRHTSPFEMCEIKFRIRVPMDCWRQWIRHRTANVNEYSTRYSVAIDAAKKTKPDEWRIQATENRQGSEGTIDANRGNMLSEKEANIHAACREVYEQRLKAGVAREQARKDLPLSTYTEAYWKIDLHNLLHFLELRMNPLAQSEIRQYANVIGHQIVSKWVPLTWEAFCDYRLNAVTFSADEKDLIQDIIKGNMDSLLKRVNSIALIKHTRTGLSRSAELTEFERKLESIGIKSPFDEIMKNLR
jgi:thymidylate synthase (FAD)